MLTLRRLDHSASSLLRGATLLCSSEAMETYGKLGTKALRLLRTLGQDLEGA